MNSRPKILVIRTFDEPVEACYPDWASDKKLNTAGVARNVRLFLLGSFDLP
jgi:hypothetical protein